MPKLSYAILKEIAQDHGVKFSADEKQDVKESTPSNDFDQVTDWLIADFSKQNNEVRQKIAADLFQEFNLDIRQLDEVLFKEELEIALLIHLLENESDENQIIDWIIKYDSAKQNGFGNITLKALENPHLFSFDGILKLVKNIAEPEKQLTVIKNLKELPFNAAPGWEEDLDFKQNKQDFFAELSRLYAQAAIKREDTTKAPQPDWEPTISLNLKDKEYLRALELGQLSVDELLLEGKKGIEILFTIYQYLYQTHGDAYAANQRNPIFNRIGAKLIDFYKVDLPDLMRDKQPGFLKSYYEAIVEKRAAPAPKAVKAPQAADLTMGVLAKPKKSRDEKQTKHEHEHEHEHGTKRKLRF